MLKTSAKFISLVTLLGLSLSAAGCGHHPTRQDSMTSQIGTHKVNVSREANLVGHSYVEEHGSFYQYNDKFLWMNALKVTIDNERVTVNEQELGLLKPNDAVTIGDEGVRVTAADGKQMDYGATKTYLQRNAQIGRAHV